jgi:preprotein translocase subunit YajC
VIFKKFGEALCVRLTGKNAVSVLTMVWQASGGIFGGGLGAIALPVVFIAAMYFLMIAPNQKKQKAWQQMLSSLKTGDRVTTSGGLRGTILQVKDDVVVLRLQPDNIKLEFVKSAISAVTTEESKP